MEIRIICINLNKGKRKTNLLQAWTGPEVSSRLRVPDFNNRHMKVIILSVLGTGRLYPHEIFPVLKSVRSRFEPKYIGRWEGSQKHDSY